MAGDLQVTIRGIDPARELLAALPRVMYTIAKTAFQARAAEAHAEVIGNTRTLLRRRTGNLAGSIRYEVRGQSLETLDASLYSGTAGGNPVVYAPIHEYGGTVYARRAYRRVPGGPYLNVPLSANQTPAGVQRYTARQVFSGLNGYLIRSRMGRWVVMGTPGGGPAVPLFVLITRATIQPRLGMRAAADAALPKIVRDISGGDLNP